MSIGFRFEGHVKKLGDFVETAQRLASKAMYQINETKDGILIWLCPMGCIEVEWERPQKSGLWNVIIDCQTTPAGAGFHKAAIEFAEMLELEDLSVYDEAEYYNHRDFEKLRREHFYPYLISMIQLCKKNLTDVQGEHDIRLSWSIDLYEPENSHRIVTPMGSFLLETMTNMLEQQGIEAVAERFFLWNNEKKDALFYRNRAVHALWIDCYFVPSSRSETDKDINKGILMDLERAYKLDPQLPLPYEAYYELCKLDDRKPVIQKEGEELVFDSQIGYRKKLITERLADLRLTLPGSYKYEWEEYDNGIGTNLWCDDSIDSPIWRISIFEKKSGNAEFSNNADILNNVEECDIRNGRIRFGWRRIKENRQGFYIMECEVITEKFFYFITVTYLKQNQRKSIVELLRKLSAVSAAPIN